MNSKQYEEYVAGVVRSLSISKHAKVYRNRRYPGVRQPGSYEIDVACEVWVDDALFFLIIVECKNWKTPVDRPQIQKLIQTRDAISAHKAAFASPVGHTKEAIVVAKANGIALWIIAQGIYVPLCGGGYAAYSVTLAMSRSFRRFIYDLFEYAGDYYTSLLPAFVIDLPERERISSLWDKFISEAKANAKTSLVPLSWLESRVTYSEQAELYFKVGIYGAVKSPDPIMTSLIVHAFSELHLDTEYSVI
jgi:hypothetical protein